MQILSRAHAKILAFSFFLSKAILRERLGMSSEHCSVYLKNVRWKEEFQKIREGG